MAVSTFDTQKNKLIKQFIKAHEDEKANYLNLLAQLMQHSNLDSSILLSKQAIQFASKYTQTNELGEGYYNLGDFYHLQQHFDLATKNYKKSFSYFVESKNLSRQAKLKQCIGEVFYNTSDFDSALVYMMQALKIREKDKNKEAIASSHNAIGNLFITWGKYDKALVYFERSLQINLELKNKRAITANYLTIAKVYLKSTTNDTLVKKDTIQLLQVIKYAKKAETIAKNEGYVDERGESLMIKGIALTRLKKYTEAGTSFLEAIKSSKENKYVIANSFTNLGIISNSLNRLKEAEQYLNKGLEIAQEINNKELIYNILGELTSFYYKINKYKEAYLTNIKYTQLKEELLNTTKYKQIEEFVVKYENQKIIAQNELLEKENKIRNHGYQFMLGMVWVSISIAVFIAIGTIFLFRFNQRIKGTYNLLEKVNVELKDQKMEITNSIKYAQHIQAAIFPSEKELAEIIGDYCLMFKPRDIVSGDFYWTSKKGDLTIACVSDCTGHGVPGAFMSIIGVSFLNEIVNDLEITEPAKILDHLRHKIIDSMNQTSKEGDIEMKDGMDIALICIDKTAKTIAYAGANNPLYLIRNNELMITKANKMPIGIIFSEVELHPFTNHIIPYQDGDVVFLFTDGYMDQFGGPLGKKFLNKQFKQVLLNMHQLPTKIIRTELTRIFNDWKGSLDQVDDVLILGIKL